MFTVGAFSQFDPSAGPLYQLSVLLAEVIAISVLNIELIGLHYRWFLVRFIFVTIFNILRIYILTSWEGIDSLVTMYILVVMNVKNVFFKSALKTFFSYFSVLNDKNV